MKSSFVTQVSGMIKDLISSEPCKNSREEPLPLPKMTFNEKVIQFLRRETFPGTPRMTEVDSESDATHFRDVDGNVLPITLLTDKQRKKRKAFIEKLAAKRAQERQDRPLGLPSVFNDINRNQINENQTGPETCLELPQMKFEQNRQHDDQSGQEHLPLPKMFK